MKKVYKKFFIAITLIALLFLLGSADIAKAGIISGITLFVYTIIPSLLPFILISELLKSMNGFSIVARLLSPFGNKTYSSSKYVIIMGLLCGFPMGAKACCDLYEKNLINISTGNYLAAIYNLLSPGFIVGFYCNGILCDMNLIIPGIIGIYVTTFILGFILKLTKTPSYNSSTGTYTPLSDDNMPISLDKALKNTFGALYNLGIYIIVFSMLTGYIIESNLPNIIKVLLCGTFEVTNGLWALQQYISAPLIKLLAGNFFISFGGICSIFQTYTYIKKCGFSIKYYIFAKLLSGIICTIVTFSLYIIQTMLHTIA